MTVQTRISDLTAGLPVAQAMTFALARFRTHNTLVTSGVATTGPEVQALMDGGSTVQGLNFINKVDTTQYNYSSDDFDEKGPVGKIGTGRYMAYRHDMNWGWAYTDLVRIVTKYDLRDGLLQNAVPVFWSEVTENIAVASVKGAIAAGGLATGAIANPFDLDLVIDAASTLDNPQGDRSLMISRKTLAKLQKANKNAYVPAAETNLGFSTFAGFNLILTEAFGDQMTVVIDNGALAFGAGPVPGLIPTEIKRDADAGNGGGGEILRTRLSMVAAPQGFTYKGPEKPTLVQLAAAASWDKVADNAFIGIRAIKHAA